MSQKMPLIVSRFINLLWANLPSGFEIKTTFTNNILFIMIFVSKDNNRVRKIKRQYSLNKIEARKDDIWGLAEDCSSEIKSHFYKRRK